MVVIVVEDFASCLHACICNSPLSSRCRTQQAHPTKPISDGSWRENASAEPRGVVTSKSSSSWVSLDVVDVVAAVAGVDILEDTTRPRVDNLA